MFDVYHELITLCFDLQMRTIMELEFQLEELDEAEQMLVQVSALMKTS